MEECQDWFLTLKVVQWLELRSGWRALTRSRPPLTEESFGDCFCPDSTSVFSISLSILETIAFQFSFRITAKKNNMIGSVSTYVSHHLGDGSVRADIILDTIEYQNFNISTQRNSG